MHGDRGHDAFFDHRHGIMRRKQLSGELDIRQIAANGRGARVTDETMPAQRICCAFDIGLIINQLSALHLLYPAT